MVIEHRCPDCASEQAQASSALVATRPSPRAGWLAFRCACGRAVTVSTASGPGRELARLGWTVRVTD